MTRLRSAGALLLLLGIGFIACNAVGLTIQRPDDIGSIDRVQEFWFIGATGSAAVLYGLASWLLCARPAPRGALLLVLVVGFATRMLVIALPPMNSTDIYRYVWDGRVQAAGINPYRYLPVDPALEPLRDTRSGPDAIFPNINRATYAPTIYPPVAQLVFALAGLVTRALHSAALDVPDLLVTKTVLLGFDALTTAAILLILRAAGRPLSHVVVWAWNPLIIWELINGGHVDGPGVTFTALAILAAIRRRPGWAGTAMGLAVLVKFLPAALFPAVWRPRDAPVQGRRGWEWRTPLACAATIGVLYACYAGVGWRVLGFLPGYANEEGLSSGGGYLLLRLASLLGPLPRATGIVYVGCALVALAALALFVLRRPFPDAPPARADVIGWGACLLALSLLVALSPRYPWYLTILVMPAVLTPRRSGLRWTPPSLGVLWPTLVGPALYLDFGFAHLEWVAFVYVPCLPLLGLDRWLRRRPLSIERGA